MPHTSRTNAQSIPTVEQALRVVDADVESLERNAANIGHNPWLLGAAIVAALLALTRSLASPHIDVPRVGAWAVVTMLGYIHCAELALPSLIIPYVATSATNIRVRRLRDHSWMRVRCIVMCVESIVFGAIAWATRLVVPWPAGDAAATVFAIRTITALTATGATWTASSRGDFYQVDTSSYDTAGRSRLARRHFGASLLMAMIAMVYLSRLVSPSLIQAADAPIAGITLTAIAWLCTQFVLNCMRLASINMLRRIRRQLLDESISPTEGLAIVNRTTWGEDALLVRDRHVAALRNHLRSARQALNAARADVPGRGSAPEDSRSVMRDAMAALERALLERASLVKLAEALRTSAPSAWRDMGPPIMRYATIGDGLVRALAALVDRKQFPDAAHASLRPMLRRHPLLRGEMRRIASSDRFTHLLHLAVSSADRR